MRRKRRKRDRPVADRAREAQEELGRGGPRVARFSKEEEAGAAFAAGVRAAGDSDRPAGSHASPEYPNAEPRVEIDVDRVFGTEPEDPDAPEPTAQPKERVE